MKKLAEINCDSAEKLLDSSGDIEMAYYDNDEDNENSLSEVETFLETKKGMEYYLWKFRNLGSKYLFSKSFFPKQKSSVYLVDSNDAKFSVLFAQFSLGLTTQSRQQFLNLLSLMKPYMLPFQPSESHQLKIPYGMSQFRNTYIDGKNAFLKLLPCPEIRSHGDGKEMHSHVEVIECLKHFLASGVDADNLLDSVENSTTKVTELRQIKREN